MTDDNQTSLPSRSRADAGPSDSLPRTAGSEATTGASTVPAGQGTPEQPTDSIAGAGCRIVDDGEQPPVAFCDLAARVALARLSMLEHVLTHVEQAQEVLAGDDPDLGLVRAMLRQTEIVDPTEPLDELVPRDEALLAVVRALQDLESADAESLLEQAIAALNALTTSGWLLVRQEGIR